MIVTCPCCKEQYRSGEVETVNIEEDFEGRDVVTFVCPECKKEVKSLVRG